uniref:Uncharacterized protein n=1 Tax=Paenibacillus polymyxa TaxID=1406 RepID=A0AAE9PVQ6_PAEPO
MSKIKVINDYIELIKRTVKPNGGKSYEMLDIKKGSIDKFINLFISNKWWKAKERYMYLLKKIMTGQGSFYMSWNQQQRLS